MRRFLLDYAIPFACCAAIAPFVERPYLWLFSSVVAMGVVDLLATLARRLSGTYRQEGR